MANPLDKIKRRLGEFRDDYGKIGFWAVYTVVAPLFGFLVFGFAIFQTADWFKTNPYGLAVFVLLVGILCGLAILSTHISMIAGWAFGFWPGLIAMICGLAIAISVNYFFSQILVAEKFEEVLESKPRIKAVHNALLAGNKLRVYAILVLIRFSLTPFAGTNYLISVSGVSYLTYFLTTIIGFSPRITAAVLIGSTLERLTGDYQTDPRFLFFSLAATITAFATISVISRRALRDLIEK